MTPDIIPAPSDEKLLQIVKRIRTAYSPLKIYLFGSHARNEVGRDSDYDILVIVEDNANERRRDSRLGYENLWGTGASVDIVVMTTSAFEKRLHLRASLPSTIMREGKLLYAA
jgi:uncharacterized protein